MSLLETEVEIKAWEGMIQRSKINIMSTVK